MEVLDNSTDLRGEDVKVSTPWGMDENTFCLLMHLSLLGGAIVPYLGLVLPIIMWATTKDESTRVNKQGKYILNAIISFIIYSVVCIVAFFVFIGFFMYIALLLCSLIFIIIGAVRSAEGETYKYPLTIEIFR